MEFLDIFINMILRLQPVNYTIRQATPGLSYGVVCVILRLAILVPCRLVTVRQTDRHTTTAYTAASIALRGKNK